MFGLATRGRAKPRDDGGGGGAVTITGDGMANVTVDLDLFVACPVPGAEPAGAAVKGTFKLAPKETVAEDGGAFENNPILRAWGWLAWVDIFEEEGPAAVVDVVLELFAARG